MHLSMHNWMRAEPVEVTIRRLAKYGYESIEISGEPEIYNTKEVRQLLERARHPLLGRRHADVRRPQLPVADEATREPARSSTSKTASRWSRSWMATSLTIVPGHRGQDQRRWHSRGRVGLGGGQHEGSLRTRQKAGVSWRSSRSTASRPTSISRGAQAMALAEAVGPECGVCLDAFHLNIEEADHLGRPSARPEAGWSTSMSPTPTAWPAAMGMRLTEAHCAHAQGHWLRWRPDRRVRRPDRSHSRQPVPGCHRERTRSISARSR